ncbi:hypothetical protein BGX38DRAFT_1173971 [Terfezia claveryi]|nr:hypothetical protein BGX38DRAFT_1173971 [Terfezia claveryi]
MLGSCSRIWDALGLCHRAWDALERCPLAWDATPMLAVALASGMHWDVAPVPGTQAYMQPLSRHTWWVNTTRLQLASATFLHQPAM